MIEYLQNRVAPRKEQSDNSYRRDLRIEGHAVDP